MNRRPFRLAMLSLALAASGSLACSSTPSQGGGAGGSTGQGGSSILAGSGGAKGTGGTSGGGTGGGASSSQSSDTGGGTSSGGSSGTGGGAAGSQGSGGASAAGGTTGAGGLTGPGGASTSGGRTASGGQPGAGGVSGSGGATGGQPGTGGATSTGGATGGRSGSGGSPATGGTGGGSPNDGGTAQASPSAGCGKTPTLKNSPTATANQNTLTISGTSRQFLMRWPSNYDNTHPYRLILDFHGAGGKDTDLAPSYFGLFDLSNNTTIFIAPSANGGTWNATTDTTFVDEILKVVEADLCIDTSRVELEGFSQGGAMVAVLACARPGIFRAAVGHSRGGLTAPTTCQPIPYLGSLGLSDISGNSQATQTDAFANWNGCKITTMPLAPTGGHLCTNYTGCPAADPVIWCSFDGPHTASPTDSGQSTSWMPKTVWPFLSQF
jgi:poly(3-hydroxybutyrate) depolymerase